MTKSAAIALVVAVAVVVAVTVALIQSSSSQAPAAGSATAGSAADSAADSAQPMTSAPPAPHLHSPGQVTYEWANQPGAIGTELVGD